MARRRSSLCVSVQTWATRGIWNPDGEATRLLFAYAWPEGLIERSYGSVPFKGIRKVT